MPISFPPSPAIGHVVPYNGKNWRWMGGRWSAVSQFAPTVVSAARDWQEVQYWDVAPGQFPSQVSFEEVAYV